MDSGTIVIRYTVTSMNGELFKLDLIKNDSSYAVILLTDIVIQELINWRVKQNMFKSIQPNDYIDNDYVCTQYDGNLKKPDYVTDHFEVLLKKIKYRLSVFMIYAIHRLVISSTSDLI